VLSAPYTRCGSSMSSESWVEQSRRRCRGRLVVVRSLGWTRKSSRSLSTGAPRGLGVRR
jgi:hypothetical protein